MATLNELGRNSASVTYGPYATGADLFPTLQAVDAWFRNDTWQGTATASGTAVTGTGTIWTTQARVGDYIMIAGQQRVVSAVNSDTSITVGSGFSPSITLPSAVKAISNFQTTQSSGYVSSFVRGSTNGVVSVTNNSQTVTGVGTYFLAEATNSVATVAMTGTVAIDTNGTITGTSTVFSAGAPTNNSLYPGDSIAVTLVPGGAVYYFIIATVTSDTAATVTIPPTIAIAGGATIAKATNGVVGRTININGRLRTITAIASNTSMTVNFPMDFTDSNLRYKVYPRGTISNANAAAGTLFGASSATSTGTTTLTLTTMTTGAVAMPGSYLAVPPGTGTATTSVPAGTYIVSQQYGTGASITFTTTNAVTTVGSNVLTMTASPTTVTVGMLVQNAASTAFSYGPASTYVVAVNTSTNTITLSNNITTQIPVSTGLYFIAPGGAGAYTTNNNTTITATALTIGAVQATGANWFWDLGYNNLSSTTGTPYMYQTSQSDNIWIGDEVRTIGFGSFAGGLAATTSTTYAYVTDYAGYSGTAIGVLRQIVYSIPFRREDSYVNMNLYGTAAAALSDLRVGDDLIIDGTECTVTSLVSNTQFKVNIDFTHTTANNSNGSATASPTYSSGGAPAAITFVVSSASNIAIGQLIVGTGLPQGTYVTNVSSTTVTVSSAFTVQAVGTYNFYNGTSFYKKLKVHGYTLEGTREGGTGLAGTTTGPAAVFTSSVATASTTALTLTTISANNALPGQQLIPTTLSGANVGGLTYLTSQQYGTSASITFTTTAVITPIGATTLTFTAAPTTVTVGMIVQSGASAAFSYGPASTYVTSVNTTTGVFTVTLNQPLTSAIPISTAIYFIAPGGPGVYNTNVATTTIAGLSFYTPVTGKWTQSTSVLATNGTSYPIGTTQLTVATAPAVGQYNFIKISGAGGPATPLTGQVLSYVSTYVVGQNTLFTTQLHIGAEIIIAGQYLTVVSIVSDTILIVAQAVTTTNVVVGPTPIYRSVPLYTYITTVSGSVITLATPTKNNIYTTNANPPQVYFPATGADFIEYVYSAPNYSAQQGTATLLNQSVDRKYVGFRYWPLYQGTNSTTSTTATITTAQGAYATPVYERWTASYGQTHGVGINQADQSGGTMVWGNLATTASLAVLMPVCGSLNTQMGVQGTSTGFPAALSSPVSFNSTTMGLANTTYTTGTVVAQTTNCPIVASLYGVYDIVGTTQLSGGTIFLFANPRYFAIQSRTSSNIQSQWMGCVEFERAQPEDASTGTGTTSGITFGGGALVNYYGGTQLAAGAATPTTASPGFNQSIQFTVGTAPYPTFAYVNGNRMPTGAQQIPTLPQAGTAAYPVHGCVLSVPRVRNTVSDLVGFNAHIYSALTVTTGRWGHMMEFGNYGTYNPAYLGTTFTPSSNTLTLIANSVPQPHMGQIVPVYTNIYNAKRFMFSPVVVLGPAYDPDVRGRLYGLKILPSALGTLMDTVSITVNNNSGTYNAALGATATTDMFYNTAGTAADHWVLTTPALTMASTLLPGQTPVLTERFTLTANTPAIQQSWRSLEDVTTNATGAASVIFYNNFRFAFPA